MNPFVRTSALALCAGLFLSACASPVAEQARAGDSKGYVAGDGTISERGSAERGEPITASGPASDGAAVDLEDLRGDVVVVNLWYAACGPCRVETPGLVELAAEYENAPVSFVGLNTRDTAAGVAAFERSFDVPYPTIVDTDGTAIRSFTGEMSPQAVPTTLVLDKRGRVAARILGQAQQQTLRSLIDTVVEEPTA